MIKKTSEVALRAILILIISLTIISCSKNIYSGLGSSSPVIYPAPPDTARIQFLTRVSGSGDLPGNRKSFAKFISGEDATLQINKPYGVVLHDGRILICDTYIHGVDIIDLKKNKFDQFIPKGNGELKVPVNCFVNDSGYLYIADSGRKQIVVFDENGNYSMCIGESEDFKPVDVFVREDKIWVTNLDGHQVLVYSNDSNHKLLYAFPDTDAAEAGSLFSPTNIYVTDNKVYVTDFGDFKIKIYTHEGKFIQSVGSYGSGLGQFTRPKGIAVDRDSNLYVVDAGFENTQIFSKEGKLLMFFGGNYKGPGDMWLPAKVTLDYDNLQYFQKYVDPGFTLKYLILVTNQFGPDKLNIYGAVEPLKTGQEVAIQPNRKNRYRQR